MKIIKKTFHLIVIITLLSCTSHNKPTYCTPLKAVELLINNPKIGESKTNTGFYTISKTDDEFVYFGYRTLNLKLNTELNPFYKTDKKEFYLIRQKTSNLNLFKADSIIENWYLEKYPELKADSIYIAQKSDIKFIYNKRTDIYDAMCNGWINFYYCKTEKSPKVDVDSVVKYKTIKEFNYHSVIKNGKTIGSIKNENSEKY